MPIQRDITGDAMHRRETVRIDPNEALAAHLTPPRPPIERVKAIKDWISNELQKKGWPDPDQTLIVSGEKWEYLGADSVQVSQVTLGWAYVQARSAPLSDDFLLAEAFSHAYSALHALNEGSAGRAFDAGYALASSIHIISSRRAHLRKVEVGKRQVEQGSAMRAERTANSFQSLHGQEAQLYADDLYRRRPEQTWAAIRNAVAQKYGVSPETVKKCLTNPKKGG